MGIKALQTLYPCIAFFIAAAVLLFLYGLTDARQAEIVGELRASEQVVEVGDDIEGEIDPHAVHAVASAAGTRRDGRPSTRD